MFRVIREIWLTIRAVCAFIRGFFVQWFLPLHGNDDEEASPGEEWFEEDAGPAHAAAEDGPIAEENVKDAGDHRSLDPDTQPDESVEGTVALEDPQ
jgi:hypothetical protein